MCYINKVLLTKVLLLAFKKAMKDPKYCIVPEKKLKISINVWNKRSIYAVFLKVEYLGMPDLLNWSSIFLSTVDIQCTEVPQMG